MRLYHSTREGDAIRREGFRDGQTLPEGFGFRARTGVWLTDRPMTAADFASVGEDVLVVVIPSDIVEPFQQPDDPMPGRDVVRPCVPCACKDRQSIPDPACRRLKCESFGPGGSRGSAAGSRRATRHPARRPSVARSEGLTEKAVGASRRSSRARTRRGDCLEEVAGHISSGRTTAPA